MQGPHEKPNQTAGAYRAQRMGPRGMAREQRALLREDPRNQQGQTMLTALSQAQDRIVLSARGPAQGDDSRIGGFRGQRGVGDESRRLHGYSARPRASNASARRRGALRIFHPTLQQRFASPRQGRLRISGSGIG